MSDESHTERSDSLRQAGEKRKMTTGWLERLSDLFLGEPKDREQLIELLHDAQEREVLDKETLRMIEGVMTVSEVQVRDIMIARSKMVIVEHHSKPEEFLPMIIESAHSRFPVIGENRDEVMGVLLAKDLLRFNLHDPKQPFDFQDILRPAMFVPESKRLDALLRDFRLNYTHMAIVVDEYGGISGLVTIEDILEEIVGNIEDEYDTEEEDENIKQQGEQIYIVKATTPIEEFNDQFNADFSDDEFDTIGGLVTSQLGHLPKVDEHMTLGTYEFKVLSADSRRVKVFQVKAA
jgi:magnesium and cobalt transporter